MPGIEAFHNLWMVQTRKVGINISKNYVIEIGGRKLALSNLDKVFWPGEGYTKADLIAYYVEVAPYLLPHLHNRPLVFTRYPHGIEAKSFYQKNAPANRPGWVPTFAWYSEESERTINFILAEEAATLAWAANLACLEIHPWLSTAPRPAYPDFVVFDLDPSPGSTYQDVRDIAAFLHQMLDELKLRSYPKTSGGEGLHIYVPLQSRYTYQEIRDFAQQVAGLAAAALPRIATVERMVNKRGSRVYVDYLQNGLGKTLSSPYSVRPRPGAPVSTPLEWSEVEQVVPEDFHLKNILPRLNERGDLFAPVLNHRQPLEGALHILSEITCRLRAPEKNRWLPT